MIDPQLRQSPVEGISMEKPVGIGESKCGGDKDDFLDDLILEVESKWIVPTFPSRISMKNCREEGLEEWRNTIIGKLFASCGLGMKILNMI